MIQKGTVVHACVSRFGNAIVDVLESGQLREIEPIEIPTSFQFNSSWKVEFACLNCDDFVEIEHNFDENKASFTIIDKLDSTNYSHHFLTAVSALFETIHVVEVNGKQYLQRTDFDYQHDIQQRTSVALTHQTCKACKADYLGLIREGLPLTPERGLESGMMGTVEIPAILLIECQSGFTSECANHLSGS